MLTDAPHTTQLYSQKFLRNAAYLARFCLFLRFWFSIRRRLIAGQPNDGSKDDPGAGAEGSNHLWISGRDHTENLEVIFSPPPFSNKNKLLVGLASLFKNGECQPSNPVEICGFCVGFVGLWAVLRGLVGCLKRTEAGVLPLCVHIFTSQPAARQRCEIKISLLVRNRRCDKCYLWSGLSALHCSHPCSLPCCTHTKHCLVYLPANAVNLGCKLEQC